MLKNMPLKSAHKTFNKVAIKRISLCVAIALFCESTANAGLSAALNGMFMQNSTSPQAYSSMTRGGYTFGGASAHWPVQNINIVSFDPPHINAGCGGIDLYGGSFSFINSAQIVALFKQIVANAAGALFQIAIQSISPSLSKIMNEFQSAMEKMNSAMKNTCAIGSAIGNTIGSDLGMQGADASQGVASLVDSATGTISDIFSNVNSSPAQNIANQVASAPGNDNLGNMTWKALSSNRAEQAIAGPFSGYVSYSPVTDREVLMSFLGTVINVPGTNPTSTMTNASAPASLGGTNPNGGPTNNVNEYPALLHVINLYEGSDPNNPLTYYGCADDGGNGSTMPPGSGCTTIDPTRTWVMTGTKTLAEAFLFGTPSGTWTTTSIGTQIPSGMPDGTLYSNGILMAWASCTTNGCNMVPAQTDFVQAIPAPIVKLLMGGELVGPGGITSMGPILVPLMEHIGYGYAISMAEAIRNAAGKGLGGAGSSSSRRPPLVDRSLAQIDYEIGTLIHADVVTNAQLEQATNAVKEMIKDNPNAYMDLGSN